MWGQQSGCPKGERKGGFWLLKMESKFSSYECLPFVNHSRYFVKQEVKMRAILTGESMGRVAGVRD